MLNKFLFFIFLIFFFSSAQSNLLDEIKERGFLKCGVYQEFYGFSYINNDNEWQGFDTDICRVVSSAIFGNPDSVEFFPTTSNSRFVLLYSGEIDMLLSATTWNYSRDTNLGFEFPAIVFFDGLSILLKKDIKISSLSDLDGSIVCIVNESKKYFLTKKFFDSLNLQISYLEFQLELEAFENFKKNKCDLFIDTVSELMQKLYVTKNVKYQILPYVFSKDPLSIAVRHNDDEWRDVVAWSINVIKLAEKYGINSLNIDSLKNSKNTEINTFLNSDSSFGDMIELDNNFIYNIIKQNGNYGEIFSRNMGEESIYNINQGLNQSFDNGGLFYVPPFR